MKVRKYCEAAALFGQRVRMPTSDEIPEGAPPLPQIPSTGEEAFERALREAESLIESYWWALAAVAERLLEKGYLTGEEVEAIVDEKEERAG